MLALDAVVQSLNPPSPPRDLLGNSEGSLGLVVKDLDLHAVPWVQILDHRLDLSKVIQGKAWAQWYEELSPRFKSLNTVLRSLRHTGGGRECGLSGQGAIGSYSWSKSPITI